MPAERRHPGVEGLTATHSMTRNGCPRGTAEAGGLQHPAKTEESGSGEESNRDASSAAPQPGPNGLDAIRARHAAATPGPYRWRGYTTSHQVDLSSTVTGNEVIGFRRWGMSRAQPVFCTDGFLYAATELAEPDTSPDRGRITKINHPDAEFIAHSWGDVRDLLAEVDRLKAEATRAAAELRHAYGNNAQGHGHDPELIARAIRILEAAAAAEVRT